MPIAAIIFVGFMICALLLAVHGTYIAWFQTEIFLEKQKRWKEEFPSFLQAAADEKYALWHVRILGPIGIVIACDLILDFILLK